MVAWLVLSPLSRTSQGHVAFCDWLLSPERPFPGSLTPGHVPALRSCLWSFRLRGADRPHLALHRRGLSKYSPRGLTVGWGTQRTASFCRLCSGSSGGCTLFQPQNLVPEQRLREWSAGLRPFPPPRPGSAGQTRPGETFLVSSLSGAKERSGLPPGPLFLSCKRRTHERKLTELRSDGNGPSDA